MGPAVVASFLHLPFNQDGPYFKRIQFMNIFINPALTYRPQKSSWDDFLIVCIKYELQKIQIDP